MAIESEPNLYSTRWFRSFHIPISDTRTIREVDFVCSVAPLPAFRVLADVCCGMGRHARSLSERGYSVAGIDRDITIVQNARGLGGGVHYIQADLRDYMPQSGVFDVVIIMGQSFGHFDAATNQKVLKHLANGMRQGGRLVLDLWNPDFFVSHQGARDFDLPNAVVHETKQVENDRLFVQLTYPNGDQEQFDWQLFTRTDMEAIAPQLGLKLIACCTDFDRSTIACASKPRIQFILERALFGKRRSVRKTFDQPTVRLR